MRELSDSIKKALAVIFAEYVSAAWSESQDATLDIPVRNSHSW